MINSTLQSWVGAWKELKQWVMQKSSGVPDGAEEGAFYYDTDKKLPQWYDGTESKDFGVAEIIHDDSLVGDGTDESPLSIGDLAITDTFVCANENAMLALDCQRGDVCVRSDLNKSFILKLDDPSIVANWQELLTPTGSVGSVFGRIGAVVARSGDYTASQITNVPAGNISSTNVQAALNELDSEKANASALSDYYTKSDIDYYLASGKSYGQVVKPRDGGGNHWKVATWKTPIGSYQAGAYLFRVSMQDTWVSYGYVDVLFKWNVIGTDPESVSYHIVGGTHDLTDSVSIYVTSDSTYHYYTLSCYSSNPAIRCDVIWAYDTRDEYPVLSSGYTTGYDGNRINRASHQFKYNDGSYGEYELVGIPKNKYHGISINGAHRMNVMSNVESGYCGLHNESTSKWLIRSDPNGTLITEYTPTASSNSNEIPTTAWARDVFQTQLTFDTAPTSGSTNPVTSGGIYNSVNGRAYAPIIKHENYELPPTAPIGLKICVVGANNVFDYGYTRTVTVASGYSNYIVIAGGSAGRYTSATVAVYRCRWFTKIADTIWLEEGNGMA